jgi:hypothetical protein
MASPAHRTRARGRSAHFTVLLESQTRRCRCLMAEVVQWRRTCDDPSNDVQDHRRRSRREHRRVACPDLHQLIERDGHGLSAAHLLGPPHCRHGGDVDSQPRRPACRVLAPIGRLRRTLALIHQRRGTSPAAPPKQDSSHTPCFAESEERRRTHESLCQKLRVVDPRHVRNGGRPRRDQPLGALA